MIDFERNEEDSSMSLESMPSTSGIATITNRTLQRDQRGLENVNQPRPVTKNAPKWFKLGNT